MPKKVYEGHLGRLPPALVDNPEALKAWLKQWLEATVAVVGGDRVNYGKKLWIEGGVVQEDGISPHRFLVAQIVRAECEGSRLKIQTHKDLYEPSLKAAEASRFLDDLDAIASYATAVAGPVGEASEADPEEADSVGPKWEYKHLYLSASPAGDESGALGGIKARVGSYPYVQIQDALNGLGRRGWELIKMEPHWFYERVGVSMAAEVTRPRAISGWYCTFKRQVLG